MSELQTKYIVESVLLAAQKPLTLEQIRVVFSEDEKPEASQIREAIESLQEDYADRGIELIQVASGFRIQVKQEMEPWISRLTEERAARYTRPLLETLSLVAYRQPITRGEIEEVRGVSVSTSIMRTLQEREWIRIVGHKDVVGRPAMYGTTKQFLDYFNLKSLDELPSLMELRDLDQVTAELGLAMPGEVSDDEEIEDDEEQVAAPLAVTLPENEIEGGETVH